MTKLSVIVVTKNEAHNISDCLQSVAFADEIIVFDSNSTDNTPEICRTYTPLVTVTPDWPGDGPQKNRALLVATGEWILCLDADERVTPALAEEIQHRIANTSHDAFSIPYQSHYCNKAIRFGDWRGESHVRLFRKARAQFSPDVVHCHLQVQGTTGTLQHAIMHYPFHHMAALLQKMNDYSTQSAQTLFAKGRKASLWTAIGRSIWTFLRGYCMKCGFLDGREGFLLAVSNAQGCYYRYVKLLYLCEKAKAHG